MEDFLFNLGSITDCADAEKFYSSESFTAMLLYNVIASLLGIILNVVFAASYYNNTLLPQTTKLIVSVYIVGKIIETVLFAGIRGHHLILHYLASTSCDILVQKRLCLYLNYFQSVFLGLPTFLHFSMAIERLLAYRNSIRNKAGVLKTSVILCLVSALLCLVGAWYAFSRFDTVGETAYCSMLTPSNTPDAIRIAIGLLIVEVLSISTSFLTYNLRKRTEKQTTFVMAQRYGQNENSYVFRLMLPWVVIHFVLSALFYISTILVVRFYDLKTQFVGMMTISGYCTIIATVYILSKVVDTVLFGSIRGLHLVKYYTAASPCDILVSKKLCLAVGFTQTLLVSNPTFLHLAMAIERVIAFWHSKRNKTAGVFVSYVLVLLAFLSATSTALYGFHKAVPRGKIPFCSVLSPATTRDTLTALAFYVGIEVLSICISVVTYFVRRRQEKRITYDMGQRYRTSENSYVFRLMLPWMLLHFTIFIMFYTVVISVMHFYDLESYYIGLVTFFGYVNIHPIYSIILPIFLAGIVWRQRNKRHSAINDMLTQDTSAGAYFKTYGWS